MKNLIQTAFTLIATLTLSLAMTSCDSSNEPDEPKPDPNALATVTSNYSIMLGDAYYRYFDITVEYNTPGGQIETVKIDEDWKMTMKLNAEEAPKEFVCKVTATPKNPLPEIVEEGQYNISEEIEALVKGYNANNEELADFGYYGMARSNEICTATRMKKYVARNHTLLDFKYSNPLKK